MDCGDTKTLKTVSLLFSDKWVEILPTDYLVPLRTGINGVEVSTGMCKLCIELSSDNDWHAGTSLLMNYYSEFDFEARTLSLQPLSGTVKPSLQSGSTPSVVLGDSIFKILILSLANIGVLTVFVLLILASIFKKNIFIPDDGGDDNEQEAAVEDSAETADGDGEDGDTANADEDEQPEIEVAPVLIRNVKVGRSELEGLL